MDYVTDVATARRTPLYAIRWPAVFAGLAVGISVQLLLMLIGMAVGLAALEPGDQADARTISVAAGVWNTVTMLIAALIGGYVAARTSGLRRTSDGVLHGVVSWGATMLLFALLATSTIGSMLGGMFGLVASTGQQIASGGNVPAAAMEVLRSVNRGDRQGAVEALQNRLGMSPEEANRIVDQASALTGQQGRAEAAPSGERAANTVSAASGWLSAAIVLSLLAGILGGSIGARGTRRMPRIEVRPTTTVPPAHVPGAG